MIDLSIPVVHPTPLTTKKRHIISVSYSVLYSDITLTSSPGQSAHSQGDEFEKPLEFKAKPPSLSVKSHSKSLQSS
jgi:hypothetical protein